MMVLLFLCLLLPAQALSENEGSADDSDDEDVIVNKVDLRTAYNPDDHPDTDKATGTADSSDQFTVIVVCVAVAVVALSVAVIVAILLVRRNTRRRQQGVYSVPAEQGQKGTV